MHIIFGIKLYKRIVGISMSTKSVPLVGDLSLFCHERDIMISLSYDSQADVIEAFNSTSRYLNVFLNTVNPYFKFIHLNCT